ncbi:tRNA lysidine(34) synthetase TilS [Cognatilysobacter bugurensis]|uniref:tRNA(Ile)-lysidine synthase n=1 Tax=Cognatilysobacter bugurensis TaxID=543356 RepID=A0A918SWG7_9GAMM|nr:tRNA lysidine(34) synthetase TilS [Lysobacter bugurensis]GHA75553.1 tRNA(Ile)-lysidine synthase [Lysobacter bugurensis]
MNSDALPRALASLPIDTPLCVGFSGGLDSTALLHALAHDDARRAQGLRAIHVHHGVHPDAGKWAMHCERTCAQWRVPIEVHRVQVAIAGTGLEAALRDARYAAFETSLAIGESLVLAHHLDDQAETFLLRALRASGVDGLGAIAPARTLGAARLIRPLLDTPRDVLLAYAHAHALTWIDDPGNADDVFDRNFLRHRVLPLLRERWPHAGASFARSAALCRADAALLDDGDAQALAAARSLDPATLRLDVVRGLQPARRARVLRRWLRELRLPPLPAHLHGVLHVELLGARSDATPRIDWAGASMRGWRDLLHASRVVAPLPKGWRCDWNGAAPLRSPDGATLALDGAGPLPERSVVHARAGGERIVLPGRQHSHALKHVLQGLGVPPWVRERVPLLSTGAGEVLAAGDLVVSHRFDAWLRNHGARLRWTPPGDGLD